MLPEWVGQPARPRASKGRLRSRFIERSLRQSAQLIEDTVFAERSARRSGFLQGLDPRAKLLSLVGLLVAASFLHHLPSLWLLGGCVAATAGISGIPPRVLFHRVWWLLPMVFAVVALPAIFSPITPGQPLVVIYQRATPPSIGSVSLPAEVSLTRQGVAAAGLVITRMFVGVLLAVTLTLTTRWQDLLRAAYTGVTAPFVLILGMTHRYVFVLLRTMENMHLGRQARTISPGSLAEQHRWVGNRVAALFSRSRRLTEGVYQAMLARGYRGEPKVLAASRFRAPEAAWVLTCAAVAALSLALDRTVVAGLPW